MHVRVVGWVTVITCGCWVNITAAAQDLSSRAATIAGHGGRIIGQAMVCGVSRDRLQQVGVSLMNRIVAAAVNADQRSYAIELYSQATLAGGQLQKDGRGDPCSEVEAAFDTLERQVGG